MNRGVKAVASCIGKGMVRHPGDIPLLIIATDGRPSVAIESGRDLRGKRRMSI